MRIHSDELSITDIVNALHEQKEAQRISHGVTFKKLAKKGSRARKQAFEVQLTASEAGDGRRAGNNGSYGSMRAEYDAYAATFDEWGWLLSALYRADPQMIVGMPSAPVYIDVWHFDQQTGLSYNPGKLIRQIRASGDPYPIVTGKGASTRKGYFVGRFGAGRQSASYPDYWPHAVRPRTEADVREFAKMPEPTTETETMK